MLFKVVTKLQLVLRAITRWYQPVVLAASLMMLLGAWIASQLWADDWHLASWFWWVWAVVMAVVMLGSVTLPDWAFPQSDLQTQAQTEETLHWVRRLTGMAMCLCLGAGWFSYASDAFDHSPINRVIPQQHAALTAELLAPGPMAHPQKSRGSDAMVYSQWVARVVQSPASMAALRQHRILVSWPRTMTWDSRCQTGCRIQAQGVLTAFESPVYRGGFDAQHYYAAHQVMATYRLSEVHVERYQPSVLKTPDVAVLVLAQRLKDRVVNAFNQALPEPLNAILSGIVLGDAAAGMSRDIKSTFAEAGLVHLLAASGMNVGLIALLFLALGRWFRWPLRVSLVVAMVGVLLYALMTGLPPSVQRATMMLELAFALKWLRQQWQPLVLLCVSGVALMLMNPFIVTMLGFQLSFLSTLGLLAMTPALQKRLAYYVTSPLAGLISIPLVAQAWVTPLTVYTFHQFPLLAVLANIVALPLTALLTLTGFSLGALAVVTYHTPLWTVTTALISLCQWPVWVLNALAQSFAHWPGAVLFLPSPPWMWVMLAYAVMGWLTLVLNGQLSRDLSKAAVLPKHWEKLPVVFGWGFSDGRSAWLDRAKYALVLGVVLLLPLAMASWAHSHSHWLAWLPLDSSYDRFHRGTLVQWVHDADAGDTLSLMVPSGRLNGYQANQVLQWLGHRGSSHVERLVLDIAASSSDPSSPQFESIASLIRVLKPASVVLAKSHWLALPQAHQKAWLEDASRQGYRLVWVEGAWQLSGTPKSAFNVLVYGRPGWTSGHGALLYRVEAKAHGGCALVGDWSQQLINSQAGHCQFVVTRPRSSQWLLESLPQPQQSGVSQLLKHAVTVSFTPANATRGQWQIRTDKRS